MPHVADPVRGTTMVRHVACATLLATVAVTQAQSTDQVLLSLKRDYGRALYSQCRLNIVVFGRQGRASLWCTLNKPGGKQLSAERALSSPEAKDLPALVWPAICVLRDTPAGTTQHPTASSRPCRPAALEGMSRYLSRPAIRRSQ